MSNSSISVVPTAPNACKPFLLDVMVFSPESGYKFKVIVRAEDHHVKKEGLEP